MKHLLLSMLIGGIFLNPQLEANNQDKNTCYSLVSCCDPKIITSNDLDDKGKFLIASPGAYALNADVTAQIDIQSSDVCLDLKGHTLFCLTDDKAIINTPDNLSHIVIKNGTISSSDGSGLGIELEGITDITLTDLTFKKIQQAISLTDCKNGILNNIDASNNTITNSLIPSVLSIGGTPGDSHTFELCNVVVSFCTIEVEINALVKVDNTDNITVKKSRINNNNFTYEASIILPLSVVSAKNVIWADSEVNNNRVSGSYSSMSNAAFANISNCHITRSEFNNATVTETGKRVYGLYASSIKDLMIDCCEANGTTAETFLGTSNQNISSGAVGIFLADVEGLRMLSTEANDTRLKLMQGTPTSFFAGPKGMLLFNVYSSLNGDIQNCQANNTRIEKISGSTGNQNAFGIVILSSQKLNFCNVSASDTYSAGNGAFGFFANVSSQLNFDHSQANNNVAQNFAAGFYLGAAFSQISENFSLHECCALANTALAEGGIAHGFVCEALHDSKIEESIAKNNTTAGFFYGKFSGQGIGNANIQTLRNCAEENGNGFVVEDEFENLLFFENKAIDNTLCGFKGDADSIWIGNRAKGNGTDFCLAPGVPVEFQKKGKLCCRDKADVAKRRLANVSFPGHCSDQQDEKE